MKVKKYALIFLLVIASALCTKTFVATPFYVPSDSMNQSIQAGERIIVSKLHYGPRRPLKPIEISFFNLLVFFPPFTKWFVQTEWCHYRWPGFSEARRNDVIVFDAPFKRQVKLVKRCIGMPGDTVIVSKHRAYANGSLVEKDPVQYTVNQYGSTSELANYGPLIIPQKQQTLPIDTDNIHFYQKAIEREGHIVGKVGATVMIDNYPSDEYTFRRSYYFMMGDNRAFSDDSRKWGLVPKENIIGKATLVFWSYDLLHGKIRWNRILKKIS